MPAAFSPCLLYYYVCGYHTCRLFPSCFCLNASYFIWVIPRECELHSSMVRSEPSCDEERIPKNANYFWGGLRDADPHPQLRLGLFQSIYRVFEWNKCLVVNQQSGHHSKTWKQLMALWTSYHTALSALWVMGLVLVGNHYSCVVGWLIHN